MKGFLSRQYEQKEEGQVAYSKEYTLMYKNIKNLLLNSVDSRYNTTPKGFFQFPFVP